MGKSSRRGFLKSATGTAAAMTLANRLPAWAEASGSVKVWSTYRDKRHAEGATYGMEARRAMSAQKPLRLILRPSSRRCSALARP